MEKELITEHGANLLMFAVLVAAPLAGLAWGASVQQTRRGLGIGLGIGIGNLALWAIYNAITDHLGLDTVKNLLVNLSLFVLVGIVVGWAVGRFGARAGKEKL